MEVVKKKGEQDSTKEAGNYSVLVRGVCKLPLPLAIGLAPPLAPARGATTFLARTDQRCSVAPCGCQGRRVFQPGQHHAFREHSQALYHCLPSSSFLLCFFKKSSRIFSSAIISAASSAIVLPSPPPLPYLASFLSSTSRERPPGSERPIMPRSSSRSIRRAARE